MSKRRPSLLTEERRALVLQYLREGKIYYGWQTDFAKAHGFDRKIISEDVKFLMTGIKKYITDDEYLDAIAHNLVSKLQDIIAGKDEMSKDKIAAAKLLHTINKDYNPKRFDAKQPIHIAVDVNPEEQKILDELLASQKNESKS